MTYRFLFQHTFPAACWICTAVAFAGQPSVTARDGNIFLTDPAGKERQLTSSGRDSNPVSDPAGEWIAFVRRIDGKPLSSGTGEHPPSELWQVRTDGKEPSRLLRTRESKRMENLIASFDDIQFSADCRLVYFVTTAWTTSGAVHVIDTTKRKEHFVVSGDNLTVVPDGEFRGQLLVQQHRYFLGGGSYDWFYLFTPAGKETGVVGETTDNFLDLYVKTKVRK